MHFKIYKRIVYHEKYSKNDIIKEQHCKIMTFDYSGVVGSQNRQKLDYLILESSFNSHHKCEE